MYKGRASHMMSKQLQINGYIMKLDHELDYTGK